MESSFELTKIVMIGLIMSNGGLITSDRFKMIPSEFTDR